MNEYPYGTSVEVRGEFKNKDLARFDPVNVACLIQRPDGSEIVFHYGVDLSVIQESMGVYSMWFLPDTVGRWDYRWRGTSAQSVANEGSFRVVKSVFTTP